MEFRKQIGKAWVIAAAGIAAMGFGPVDKVTAAETCFQDWSEAALLVREQKLVAAKDLQTLVRQKMAGKIVKLTLCLSNGSYEYRLVVFRADGGARNVVLDARRPFDR